MFSWKTLYWTRKYDNLWVNCRKLNEDGRIWLWIEDRKIDNVRRQNIVNMMKKYAPEKMKSIHWSWSIFKQWPSRVMSIWLRQSNSGYKQHVWNTESVLSAGKWRKMQLYVDIIFLHSQIYKKSWKASHMIDLKNWFFHLALNKNREKCTRFSNRQLRD